MCIISKINNLIERSNIIHNYTYDYSLAKFTDFKSKNEFICKEHGIFKQSWGKHIYRKQGCRKCGYEKNSIKRAKTNEQFIIDIKKLYGDTYILDKIIYTKSNIKITPICKIHGEFSVLANSFLMGHACPKCGIERRASVSRHAQSFFIKRAIKKHNGFYLYDLVDYVNANTKVKIRCPLHGIFEQAPTNHTAGQCCPVCATKRVGVEQRQTKEEFIVKAIKVHGDRNDYSLVDYQGNKTPVDIKCILHNAIYTCRPDNHLAGSGCPICNSSRGENKIASILNEFEINFIREYKIEGHRYRYDFYIKDHNLLIEYDGPQHFRPVECFGGEQGFIKTLHRDKEKNELAKKNKIKLLRINYINFTKIKSILLKYLKLKHI